jgi:curved DNA-binding protein CbpA
LWTLLQETNRKPSLTITLTNFYHILGLDADASSDDIKRAYRKLSIKFHPDKNPGDRYFEEWTKKVNEAYATLSNPSKKAGYDYILKRDMQPAVPTQNGNLELLLLREIRSKLPEYYDLKNALEQAQQKYDHVSDQEYPVIITPLKAVCCILGIIAGIAGLWYALIVAKN